MLHKYIAIKIREAFTLTPMPGQQAVFESMGRFLHAKASTDALFLLKGYAGTGKTSVIAALVKASESLGLKTVLMAPTGRAAKVLSKYAEKQSYTIHKKIYRQKSSSDGFGKFVIDKNLHTNTIFIIDEASMINNSSIENSNFGSGRMLDDLIDYVYSGKNCKLILSGDTAQLPPVHSDLSPALDKKVLEAYGKDVTEHELTEIVRQAESSGILMNATRLREKLSETKPGATNISFPQIHLNGFTDVQAITGRDLIEAISDAYSVKGEKQVAVICRSNKRANRFNLGIRNSVLYMEDELTSGDLLMVVKNNYFWLAEDSKTEFIANGDIAEVQKVYGYEERYGFRFADVRLSFFDYNNLEIDTKILLDTLQSESPSLTKDEFTKLYHNVSADFLEIKNKRNVFEKVRNNPYFNALQVKYAYAFTCHKAQGGQWHTVFVDQGWITKDMINTGFFRWLYTAFTRAEKQLFLVNFNKDFFEGKFPLDS